MVAGTEAAPPIIFGIDGLIRKYIKPKDSNIGKFLIGVNIKPKFFNLAVLILMGMCPALALWRKIRCRRWLKKLV